MRDRIAHPNVTFAALSLLFFVVSAGSFSSLGVVLPAMVKELEWSWTEAGLGFTLLGLTCGLGSFIPALLIRRIGVRGTMLVGTTILVAGFGAMALTTSVWLYFIATSLVGVAFAVCATVPGTHVLTALFDKRSTALGGYFTIGALGGVAGPLLYIALHDLTDGWRAYWWAFVIMSLMAGLFAAITTPWRYDPTEEELAAERNLAPAEVLAGLKAWTVRKALATPQFYIIVGGYTTYLLINTTAHGFAVAHLMERGISQTVAAQILSLEALIGAGVGVIGGIIGEKVSSKMLMLVSLGAVTIGMVGLAYATGWPLMLVFAFGVGIGFGLSFIASTMLLFNYFGRAPNLELYSIMTMISTTAALGPAFGGWARDTFGSFSGLFLLCAALTALMLLATLFMQPPDLKRAKEPANPVPEAPIL